MVDNFLHEEVGDHPSQHFRVLMDQGPELVLAFYVAKQQFPLLADAIELGPPQELASALHDALAQKPVHPSWQKLLVAMFDPKITTRGPRRQGGFQSSRAEGGLILC